MHDRVHVLHEPVHDIGVVHVGHDQSQAWVPVVPLEVHAGTADRQAVENGDPTLGMLQQQVDQV
jgi:hypothetical protein